MLEDSNDSTNFSVRRSLPLIRQDSVTHRHNLAVYVMAVLLFASGSSLENPDDSFKLTLLHSVIMIFSLYQLPYCSFWTVFDTVSSVLLFLSINPFLNVFVSVDFLVHQKDWLTYSGRTDRPSGLCQKIFISNKFSISAKDAHRRIWCSQ